METSQRRTMKTDSNGYSALENGSSKIKEMPESTKTHPVVYMVFLSLLLDLLAFTMILPLFPSLLDYYRTNDKDGLYVHLSNSVKYFQEWVGAPEKYTSVLFGGVLGSMFSFLQFLSAPLFGGLSDYYGRKRVMLVSLLGISLSYVVWALSKNFGIFVIARIIGGLSKGNISLCMAIITDVSNKNNRGKGMALVGIAFSIGFILGPMIGAMFSKFSDKSSSDWFVYPAMFAICLSVINILFVSLCLKETLPKEKRSKTVVNSLTQTIEHISIPALFRFDAVKNISKLDLKSLKQLGYVYFLYLFIYSGLEFTVTFLMYHKFNFNSMDQARMFLMTGVVMALLQGAVVRRIPPHLTKKSAVIGLYLIVPAYVIVGFAESVRILYLGMFLYSVSTAFVVTCLTTLASKYGNFDQKGVVLGIFRSLGALARALGPVIASTAFWSAGSTITYLVGGVILLYPTLLLQYSKLS